MRFSRHWAMPSADTFSVQPIGAFVKSWLHGAYALTVVDPFARNSRLANYTNDLNPNTAAEYHMDAEDFLLMLAKKGIKANVVLFDPPYSPRQISECYKAIDRDVGMETTQNGALYARVRRAIIPILADGAIVLSFGWNSCGMGKQFEMLEIMLVAHGGAHNDTICLAERYRPEPTLI